MRSVFLAFKPIYQWSTLIPVQKLIPSIHSFHLTRLALFPSVSVDLSLQQTQQIVVARPESSLVASAVEIIDEITESNELSEQSTPLSFVNVTVRLLLTGSVRMVCFFKKMRQLCMLLREHISQVGEREEISTDSLLALALARAVTSSPAVRPRVVGTSASKSDHNH